MLINNLLKLIIVVICIKCTYSWSYNPYCWVAECCDNETIPGDIPKLRRALNQRVYGQHLVNNVVDAIAAHWGYHKSQKALTLSFHGWPGSGKNYVSKFIADSLYKYGSKSKYVHHFIGRIHFPLEENAQIYKENLYMWLKGNITKCPKQLFIFDEVDKMPATVLNGIKPMIDYRDMVDGVDYTRSIFIFLSNTGAGLINEHYEQLWHEGKKREDLRQNDFENLISKGAFNEEGGFHRSDTIKSNLIDHYIPFLPMEERHVVECIKDEFRLRNVDSPSLVHIKEVLEFIEWGPDSSKLFSKTGCKRISAKVAVLVAKYYVHYEPRKEL
ncbi:torsin-1A isoform X2 [Anoplophora glabripennis]|uniref:torsin-1A isoform X2 n=1 Tax=Anoplophora glabripennis TaxID=217634 RepID=UPI0008748D92|nr:torsin-1A isoform X2 [Anoplophora glabripennis]